MCRELTSDEVVERFLDQIEADLSYWITLDGKTEREKMRGLVFSILVLLDGESTIPSHAVIPCPHPDDKQYHKENGENWYPPLCEEDPLAQDITGDLHERWSRRCLTADKASDGRGTNEG